MDISRVQFDGATTRPRSFPAHPRREALSCSSATPVYLRPRRAFLCEHSRAPSRPLEVECAGRVLKFCFTCHRDDNESRSSTAELMVGASADFRRFEGAESLLESRLALPPFASPKKSSRPRERSRDERFAEIKTFITRAAVFSSAGEEGGVGELFRRNEFREAPSRESSLTRER